MTLDARIKDLLEDLANLYEDHELCEWRFDTTKPQECDLGEEFMLLWADTHRTPVSPMPEGVTLDE